MINKLCNYIWKQEPSSYQAMLIFIVGIILIPIMIKEGAKKIYEQINRNMEKNSNINGK